MLADDIATQKQRELIAALDAGERRVAQAIGDLIAAPELEPGDTELLAPWLEFCKHHSCRHAPAKSWVCAAYAIERHKRGIGGQQIISELRAISRLHFKFRLADPCSGPVIDAALEQIVPERPPRSWRKDEWSDWWSLPGTTKAAIKRRHDETETCIRKLQNELAAAKKRLQPDEPKAVEQKEKEITNGS
jgi:hypothetical protein